MRYLKGDSKTIETFVGTLPKELLGADPNLINETKGAFGQCKRYQHLA